MEDEVEIAPVSSTMPILPSQWSHLQWIDVIGRDTDALALTLQFATVLASAPAAPSRQPGQVAQFPSADPIARGQHLLDITEGNWYKSLHRGRHNKDK